jgi:class 3 adenylate cyclase
VFSRFDAIVATQRVEKIKTIGDAYMAAAGLPGSNEDHAVAVARTALQMRDALADICVERKLDLHLRIGIHTGPVMAGVIGVQRFRYDLWGDTVNTASRMESQGRPGRIQISEATATALGEQFAVDIRGVIDVKGKGSMRTYWLISEKTPTLAT